MFTRFGGVTDIQVKDKIARGRRIRAMLAQPQYAPLRLADEVALLLALQGGLLDRLPMEQIGRFAPGCPPGSTERGAGRRGDRPHRRPRRGREPELKASCCARGGLVRHDSRDGAPRWPSVWPIRRADPECPPARGGGHRHARDRCLPRAEGRSLLAGSKPIPAWFRRRSGGPEALASDGGWLRAPRETRPHPLLRRTGLCRRLQRTGS